MKIRGLVAGVTALVTFFSLNLIIPSLSAGLEATPSPGTQTEPIRYQKEELRQIVAPIALYPDPLLAQIFMASTYPIDVVLASRWLKEKGDLKDDALDSALKDKEWDASVKSLAHFPEVLFLLNENLEWTNKLGYAFLNQRKEVMEAVQYLRQRAKDEGNLRTTPEQKVLIDDQVLRIEPAYSSIIYVPCYNPAIVYGTWYYPATPWFVYPVRPCVYPVPYGFWWGYTNWVYWDVFVYDDDRHHHDCDDHHGDHHHDGDKHHDSNHGKDYHDGKDGHDGGWKRWQHDQTRGVAVASRDRGTIRPGNRSFVRDRQGRAELRSYVQSAPIRQRPSAFQSQSRQSVASASEGRRDGRSYSLGTVRQSRGGFSWQSDSFSRPASGSIRSGVGERIHSFRSSTGSGLARTDVPRIQLNTGGGAFQGGSLFRGGGSFRGGSFQGGGSFRSMSTGSSGGRFGGSGFGGGGSRR